jgi:hypothetical protein
MASGAAGGAAFDLTQQATGLGIHAITNGQAGQDAFSWRQLTATTAFGGALGGVLRYAQSFEAMNAAYKFQIPVLLETRPVLSMNGFGAIKGFQSPLVKTGESVNTEFLVANAAEATATPNGKFYSVAFETKLDPSVWGKADGVHFNRSMVALDDALRADPAWAAEMEVLIPGVQSSVSRVGGRTVPDGWVWHHDVDPGVMQLVQVSQHWDPAFWNIFHPGGRGGYAIWARPAGAPPRR